MDVFRASRLDGEARFDHYTDFDAGKAWAEVNHAESARANLEEVPRELMEAALPDVTYKAIRGLIKNIKYPDEVVLRLALLPLDVAWDVGQMVLGPLGAVKDLADAAVHGILAGIQKDSAKSAS